MYKKYSKYKNKYLSLKQKLSGGLIDDPDLVDWDDEFIVAEPESEYSEDYILGQDVDEQVQEETSQESNTELLGFNETEVVDETQDTIKEATGDKIAIIETVDVEDQGETEVVDRLENDLADGQTDIDIGIFAKARGKLYRFEYFDNFDPDIFIQFFDGPNKQKILKIQNNNSFDSFTDKYGYTPKKDENGIDICYIKWDAVAHDYKGFYLVSSALDNREVFIPFNNNTVRNWIPDDYNFLDKVVIFNRNSNRVTAESMLETTNIKFPFSGKIVDVYGFDQSKFTPINKKPSNDQILLIDNIKSFDKFTNKYGTLDNNEQIKIKWNNVADDYKGFYIDKDNDFYKNRNRKAFLNGTKYKSWIKNDKILDGLVYLFD